MTERLSLRLDRDQAERLERERAMRGMSRSALVRVFLEEGLRMQECPGISFVDTPTGRQATIAGTGLPIWQVMMFDREVDQVTEKVLEQFPHLSERDVRHARAYTARYAKEIDEAIARYQAATETEVRRQYPHLFAQREAGQ